MDPDSPEDPPQNPPENSPDSPPVEPASSERTFTQQELGQHLAAERKRVREQVLAERAAEQPQPTPKVKDTPKNSGDAALARIEELELQVNFGNAAAAHPHLTAEQRKVFEDMAKSVRPADMVGWLSGVVGAFGTPTSDTPQGEPVPTAPVTPASDRGGPSPTPDAIRSDDPRQWSNDHVQRIIDGEKNWQAGVQKVRRAFMDGISGLKLEFPRGGK